MSRGLKQDQGFIMLVTVQTCIRRRSRSHKIPSKRWQEEQKPRDVKCIHQGNPRTSTRAGSSSAHVPWLLPAHLRTGLHRLLLLHILLASDCAHPCFAVPLPVAWNQAQCAQRHISASSAWVLQVHCCPCRFTASAALPKLFSSHCFVTTELRVTAIRRGVGYHLQTETGWPHSFSEQKKPGNLLKMIAILHIHLRYLWCNSKTDNVLNWKHRDIRWIHLHF